MVTMDFGFMARSGWTQPLVPFPTGPSLKSEYPEVQAFARWSLGQCEIKYGSKIFDGIRCVSADSSVFNILTLPFVQGNSKVAFTQRDYAVISRGLAEKLFGSRDAIGKVIDVDWLGQRSYFTVTAVMRNIPSTSTFQADCILPIIPEEESIQKRNPTNPDVLHAWMPGVINTYLLLSNRNSAKELEKKLVEFSKQHSTIPSWPLVLHLFSLKDMYFRPATMVNTYSMIPMGNLSDVEIYSAIALLTLLLACVNFVMLSTARASARTKEIGVRKVIGASRLDVVKQTMIESLVVAAISLPAALLLVELFMPSLTDLLGKRLPAEYSRSLQSIMLYIGITLLAGIVSGSYVSIYLSRFHPAEILRIKFSQGNERVSLRRALIGIQMVIFVGLILASVTIYRQIRYLHTKNMGFNDKNLVIFSRFTSDDADTVLGDSYAALESNIETISNVVSVACGSVLPGTQAAAMQQAPNLSDPQKLITFEVYWVSRDFFDAMGIKMVYGKTFSQASPEESKDAVMMNQEAVKDFGITSPSEQLFQGHRILGVVKDFNFHSLHKKIVPTVFYDNSKRMQEIAVRLKHMNGAQGTIATIEKEVEKFDGGRRFGYQFFDDRLSAMYGSDYKFADMIGYFTGLAIFIACLGLFGMSLLVIQRRVKEIGVRKVLGASVTSILLSTVKEFVILLLISTILSLPISFYFIDKWLNEYAYHINISVVSVLLAFLAGLVIVLLTISYQALRAATANPVEALRYE